TGLAAGPPYCCPRGPADLVAGLAWEIGIRLPARPVVRVGLAVVGGIAALACGFADVFRPAGPEPVTIIYVGDSVLHRDSTVPFSVVVEAGGMPVDRPHLTLW